MIQFNYSGENVYIILSQTGTLTSKFLKRITKEEYNHASISLDEGLNEMCSFARYFTYYPFYGGLIKESMKKGVLKHHKNAEGVILKFTTTKDKTLKVKDKLNEMFKSQKKYKYDIIGVIFASFGKKKVRKNKFYCTEFCKKLLIESEIINAEECPEIMHVTDFLKLSNAEIVYKGNLHEYYNLINKSRV